MFLVLAFLLSGIYLNQTKIQSSAMVLVGGYKINKYKSRCKAFNEDKHLLNSD